MRDETLEWIQKAEGDFASATREVRARKNRNEDSACFHCQQCIEKYLKALLVYENIDFIKTHSLKTLMDQIHPNIRPDLSTEEQEIITNYAVFTRYP